MAFPKIRMTPGVPTLEGLRPGNRSCRELFRLISREREAANAWQALAGAATAQEAPWGVLLDRAMANHRQDLELLEALFERNCQPHNGRAMREAEPVVPPAAPQPPEEPE